jgi:hypothetical protein
MMYYATVAQFSKMLTNLSKMLDKADQYAQEKKFAAEVLLNSRLAPDQFNLIRQIQICCDMAKFCAASLAGKEIPQHPDTEKTLPELKDRIDRVVHFLNSFKTEDFAGACERKISHHRWEGKHLDGEEFFIQHSIPNFYFHLTTAYSILRHNGVPLGKRDYLGPINYR